MQQQFIDQSNVLENHVRRLSASQQITAAINFAKSDAAVKLEIRRSLGRMRYDEITEWYLSCLRHPIKRFSVSYKDIPPELEEKMEEMSSQIISTIRHEAAMEFLGVNDDEWMRLSYEADAESDQSDT
jgi:hypothetical protein